VGESSAQRPADPEQGERGRCRRVDAADLRLTFSGFYRHFESKEDLFADAFEHDLMASCVIVSRKRLPRQLAAVTKALIDAT